MRRGTIFDLRTGDVYIEDLTGDHGIVLWASPLCSWATDLVIMLDSGRIMTGSYSLIGSFARLDIFEEEKEDGTS